MTNQNQIEAIIAEVAGARGSAVRFADGIVRLVLDVAELDRNVRDRMEIDIKGRLLVLDGVDKVQVAMTAEKKQLRMIAIASGKGGVGKSTFATNLAVALQRMGRKTGLVDADIYGPSQPRMLDCEDIRPEAQDGKLVPIGNAYNVPVLSMGHLLQHGQAVAWRGPMASNALGQLIDAQWGDVTDIIVDMPPGTGDVPMSMVQKHKPVGAVIVSTPQDIALMDAMRAIDLFRQSNVPIIGIVENMAGYACPHCGEVSDPFGIGGAEAAAKAMSLPFLGRVPLDAAIRKASDAGVPPASGEGPQADAFKAIAVRISDWIESQKPA